MLLICRISIYAQSTGGKYNAIVTTPLVLALAPSEIPYPTVSEPWVQPDQLGQARANEMVDLQSVCVVATDILYLLSGRRFGVRSETVRPFSGQRTSGWAQYLLANTSILDTAGVGFPWSLLEMGPDFLYLKGPVQSVDQVKIDGQVLDSSEYVLYDQRKLIRISSDVNGMVRWPIGQNVELPDTEVGTFSVAFTYGTPVPAGGLLAAQVFAIELSKLVNKEPSALADRTISITRQGVTQQLDPGTVLDKGKTGIFLVDAWLHSVNPSGARSRPRILGPDSTVLLHQS